MYRYLIRWFYGDILGEIIFDIFFRAAVVCALKPQNPEEEQIFQMGEGIYGDITFLWHAMGTENLS